MQIVRAVLGMLCVLPLPLKALALLVVPALMFITPINQIVFWLVFFLPIWSTDTFIAKGADGKREFKTTFRNSYLIYHFTFFFVYAVILRGACAVNDMSPI